MSKINACDIFDYENLITMPYSSRVLFDCLLEWLFIKGTAKAIALLPLEQYASGLGISRKKDIEKQAKADADFLMKLELRLKAGKNYIRPFYDVSIKNDYIFFGFDLAFLVAIEKYLEKTKKA